MEAIQRNWQKRLPDFEVFDRIELKVIPRYKTSGLSGDEWRQHVQINLYFKGELIMERQARTMEAAAVILANTLICDTSPIPNRVLALEEQYCFQPSCAKPWRVIYWLKDLFSHSGEKLDAEEKAHSRYYRRFCDVHAKRGNCGREDADRNYDLVANTAGKP